MQVKFKAHGIEPIMALLHKLPRGAAKAALAAISEYFIGSDKRGLRHAPNYKYVSRKKAYGQTFQSDKQRRWFFANKMQDKIGNNRTGATQAGWYSKVSKGGYGMVIGNDTPGAYYTMSDKGQAAQPAKVGWQKVSAVIESNIRGAMKAGIAAVGAFIKRGGK
jgi:hypothetical protein